MNIEGIIKDTVDKFYALGVQHGINIQKEEENYGSTGRAVQTQISTKIAVAALKDQISKYVPTKR